MVSAVYEVVIPSGLNSVALLSAQIWDDFDRDSTSLSAALVLQHLNMAYQYIAQQTKCFRAHRQLTGLVNGDIVLPSDTREVTDVRHAYGLLAGGVSRSATRPRLPELARAFRSRCGWVRRAPLMLKLVSCGTAWTP